MKMNAKTDNGTDPERGTANDFRKSRPRFVTMMLLPPWGGIFFHGAEVFAGLLRDVMQ